MSFDLLAPHYRWMEWLTAGEKLQHCRIAFLDAIPTPANVLIYGEGNGRFLVELCRRFPAASVTVVDESAGMIVQARRRLQRTGLSEESVQFIHADALAWIPPSASFDLIVTCFFLDCFREEQLQRLIPTIARAAQPKARWLVADFQIAKSGLWRMRSRMIVALLYAFFRLVTRLPGRELIDPSPHLCASGFSLVRREEHDHGMLHTDWWER